MVAVEVAPYATARVAAWPIEALDPFGSTALAALARAVNTGRAAITSARAGLCDRLGAVVPRLDRPGRAAALAGRRTLHRDVAPLDGTVALAALVAPLDAGLARALVADDRARRELAARHDELAAAIGATRRAERRALYRVGAGHRFLVALTVGNPELALRWRRHLARSGADGAGAVAAEAPTARVRRLEDAVFHHLCRAVGRVAPSGCWAGTVPVLPAPGGGGLTATAGAGAVAVEPDLRALEGVVAALGAATSVGEGHPLRRDPGAAVPVDVAADPFCRLVLDAFAAGTHRAPTVLATLGQALGGRPGVATRLEAAVGALLGCGALVSAAALPRGAADAWAALDDASDLLGAGPGTRLRHATQALRAAATALGAAVAGDDPDAVAAALDAAGAAVGGVRREAGLGPWPGPVLRVSLRPGLSLTWGGAARAGALAATRAVLAWYGDDGVAEAARRSSMATLRQALAGHPSAGRAPATLPPGGHAPAAAVPLTELVGVAPFTALVRPAAAADTRDGAWDGTSDDASDDTWDGAARRAGAGASSLARAAAERLAALVASTPAGATLHLDPPGTGPAPSDAGPSGSLRFELAGEALELRGGRPEPGFGALGRPEWFPELAGEVRSWFDDWSRHGVDAVEVVGADPANPNAALGPPVAARRLGPVPGGLDPTRLGVLLGADDRPYLVALDAGGGAGDDRPAVPVHTHHSAVGTHDPLTAGLVRMARAHGWEWPGRGVPLLRGEVATEGRAPLPRAVLGPGTVLAGRRWVLDGADLAAVAGRSGVERYLAWRAMADGLGLPARALVRVGPDPDGPERLLCTDSPLGVEAFVASLGPDPARAVARELPADPAHWPVRSGEGHHLAELVVSWRDPGFWPRHLGAPAAPASPSPRARRGWAQVVWALHADASGRAPAVPWDAVAAAVADLRASGAVRAWYTRKAGLRLRAEGDTEALDEVLKGWSARLVAGGRVVRATWPPYEPEEARFGGPAGMALAHDLFDADTTLALREHLDAPGAPLVHRAALAVVVQRVLVAATVDDDAEAWDVWVRLDALARAAAGPTGAQAARRGDLDPGPGDAHAGPGDLHADPGHHLDAVLADPGHHLDAVLADPGHHLDPALVPLLAGGVALAERTAVRLRDVAASGSLRIGVRAWLVAAAPFHWNRRDLGLDPAALAAATGAAVRALAP